MKTAHILASSLLLLAPAAFAHSSGGHVHDFLQGIQHPIAGWDHLLAMLAVGIWSAQQGGRRLWALPAAFVLTMALGGAIGMAGYGGDYVETGITLSVAVFGLLTTQAAHLPMFIGIIACAAAALAHGIAHGAELPYDSSAASYGTGFLLSTALLHVGGIALGQLGRQRHWVNHVFGCTATLAGSYLLLAIASVKMV